MSQNAFALAPALVPISARNEAPSATSPLTYRERAYFVPGTLGREQLESLLRTELSVLQKELAGVPRGQLVRLAVFDHAFEHTPRRAPLATLEWKDWQGEAVFATPGVGDDSDIIASQTSQTRLRPVPPAPAPQAQREPTAQAATPPSTQHAPAAGYDRDHRLADAFDAVQDLYFLSSPAEGLELAVNLLAHLVPCDALSGCLYDINTDELRFVALSGPGAGERRATSVPSTRGLMGMAAHSGRDVVLVPDATSDPRFVADVDGRPGVELGTVAYLPLHESETQLGMLQLLRSKSSAGFSDDDLAVAGYIATQLSGFLQSRRHIKPRRR